VQGLDIQRFHLTPYLARLDFFGKTDVYDTFSQGGDTDKDGLISLLEFSPVGVKDRFDPTKYIFPKVLYRMTNLNVAVDPDPTIAQGRTMGDEVNDQLAAKPRPMIYIPVLRMMP